MLISSLNWLPTLSADVPATLKPQSKDAEFFCTDRQGSESIATAYRENADCHDQLKTATSTTDWSTVLVTAAAALLGGIVIGQATK